MEIIDLSRTGGEGWIADGMAERAAAAK